MLPLHQTGYKSVVGASIPVVTTRFIHFAERQGFEPQIPFPVCQFSRLMHSTTLPSLQVPKVGLITHTMSVLDTSPSRIRRVSMLIQTRQSALFIPPLRHL
jgi:hypothetical protein